MRVVSNTSPISNLAIIGRLSLLRQRYGRLMVPPAVERELRALTHVAAQEKISAAFREGWLLVEPVPERSVLDELRMNLDVGEAEAIALAVLTSAGLLLIDERRGRTAARKLHLKVAGVLGELLFAKFRGELTSMREEMRKLRIEARFFIGADLEQFILSEAGE
jgi:predicted nucleic acid-binding protein